MPSVIVQSAVLVGIEAAPVTVVARAGVPFGFTVRGVSPEREREITTRVSAALSSVEGLHPFDVEVVGVPRGARVESLDLAIAVAAYSAATGEPLPSRAFFGQLALNGKVLPTRGAVAAARLLDGCYVPHSTPSPRGYGVRSLLDALQAKVEGTHEPPATADDGAALDFSDIMGLSDTVLAQLAGAVRARRPIFLRGVPGAGKTMIARRLGSLLPPPTEYQRQRHIEIADAVGLSSDGSRSFRAPHHTCSARGLLGGGAPCAPGEITIATGGVLYLDEVLDFDRTALELVAQALRDGCVRLSSEGGTRRLPAEPALVVLASDVCPCGRHGRPGGCVCPDEAVRAFARRAKTVAELFGAVVVNVDPATTAVAAPSSADMRARIWSGRDRIE